jgi:hypothetical protein
MAWGRPRRSEIALDQPAEALTEQRLRSAIDVVSEDAALVELWACALSGFAQPIPDYPRTTDPRLPRAPNISPYRAGGELESGR